MWKYRSKQGMNLGIKDLCITSKERNTKIQKPSGNEKKLAKLQRQLAHKKKRSQNYCKIKKDSIMP